MGKIKIFIDDGCLFMRIFTEKNIKNYMEYVNKNIIELNEVIGNCFQCGEKLSVLELPKGPEKEVVCLKDREYFVEEYEMLIEEGELKE